mgnify:CR=1 FL=1
MEDIEIIAGTEGIDDYNITTVTTAARPIDFMLFHPPFQGNPSP